MQSRSGQSLLVMVLLLVVLAGVMALTLDFGFVLMSRRQMQSAVNTAALEGGRDIDGMGRENAREFVRNTFDDDLDPSHNASTIGAGIEHSLVQRDANDRPVLGQGTGSQGVFQNRLSYIYRPELQLNPGNAAHGDLVIGEYDEDSETHAESHSYLRSDFQVVPNGNAFLARLRKTPIRSGVANVLDREPSVSSSGTGSPLLMGHLTWFRVSPPGTYDIRRDGVTVRATAIADTKPIVHVGSGNAPGLYSAIPFGLSADTDQYFQLTTTHYDLGEIVERVDSDLSDSDIDPVDFATLSDSQAVGYLPVISEVSSGVFYVVGFQLSHRNQSLLPNASPRLSDAWQALSGLSSAIQNAVLERHRQLAGIPNSVLSGVPALVRALP